MVTLVSVIVQEEYGESFLMPKKKKLLKSDNQFRFYSTLIIKYRNEMR